MSLTRGAPADLLTVEREARWRIWALFALLLLVIWLALVPVGLVFVELALHVSADKPDGTTSHLLELTSTQLVAVTHGLAFGLALALSGAAWVASRRNARERLMNALGARALEPGDSYHHRLLDVVDEVRLAAGLAPVSCVTVPGIAMNAFAFSITHERAVVGVTEGALSRLSRAQLQAVVAHEAAHLASRDCVTATRACLLFIGLYRMRDAIGRGADRLVRFVTRADDPDPIRVQLTGYVALALVVVGVLLVSMVVGSVGASPVFWYPLFALLLVVPTLILLTLAQPVAAIVELAISREREFVADLASARYTRDPVSLAEALMMMGAHRGAAGPLPASLALLCMVPPLATGENRGTRGGGVEAGGGWLSSHPPLTARIERLLVVARQQGGDPTERVAEIERRLLIHEHVTLPPATHTQHLEGLAATATATDTGCPGCGTGLRRVIYEGVPVLICPTCDGRLVTREQVDAILARREMGVTREQEQIADLYEQAHRDEDAAFTGTLAPRARGHAPLPLSGPNVADLICPRCSRRMRHQDWNDYYRILVGRCDDCDQIWFDHDRLEVLQILVERQTS